MTIVSTLPVKIHCEKCGWTEELDYEKHGPEVPDSVFGHLGFMDLKDKPTVCAECRNAQLIVERGTIFDLKGHPLYSDEWATKMKKRD